MLIGTGICQHVRIAVIGNGNVALDVARVLAKPASQMLSTEIPDNVYQGSKHPRLLIFISLVGAGPW